MVWQSFSSLKTFALFWTFWVSSQEVGRLRSLAKLLCVHLNNNGAKWGHPRHSLSSYYVFHSVWKSPKMSYLQHFNFGIFYQLLIIKNLKWHFYNRFACNAVKWDFFWENFKHCVFCVPLRSFHNFSKILESFLHFFSFLSPELIYIRSNYFSRFFILVQKLTQPLEISAKLGTG